MNISADEAAIQTSGEGKVTIELDGTNTVQSGEGYAGLEKNNSGYLTITDKNGESGSLTATGGKIIGFHNKDVLKEIGTDPLEGMSVILKAQKNATQKQEATLEIKKNGVAQQISQSPLVELVLDMSITEID